MGLTQITGNGLSENINIDSNTLKVDGTNNRVGIGTGSPTSKLTVAETGYSAVEIRSNRTSATDNIGAIHFRTVSTDVAYIQSLVDGTLKFRNTSALTERMRIDTSGRVLINETAAATANSFLTVKNGSGDCEVNVMSGPTSSSVINLGDTGDYNIGRIKYDQSTNSLRFDTNNTERFKIDSSGNTTFEYADSSTSTSTQLPPGLRIYNTDNTSGRLAGIHFSHGGAGTANAGIFHVTTNTATNSTTCLGDLAFYMKGSGSSTMSEAMRINSSGNVGIGTTSPTSNRQLTLSGNDAGLQISGSGAAGANTYITLTPGSSAAAYIGTTNSRNLNFVTNGATSSRMTIDSSGRLMVGTTSVGNSEADDLTIATSGTTGMTIRSGTSGNGNLFFADSTSGNAAFDGFIQYQHANRSLKFGTASNEAMRIANDGKVGIGTTAAAHELQVSKSGSASAIAATSDVTSGTASRFLLGNSVGTARATFNLTGGGSELAYLGTEGNFPMYFQTNGAERMRIDGDGVVKINQSAYNTLRLQNPTSNGANMLIQNSTTGTSAGNGLFFGLGDNEFTYLWNYHNEPIVFATNNTERARITSDGKALFGGTTSTAAKWNFYDTDSSGMAWVYNTTNGNYRRAYLWGNNTTLGLYFTNGNNEAALTSSGVWSDASDARIKKDIEPISYGLAEVMASQPRKYKMRSNDEDCIGFVAQEMREIVPEVVSGGESEDRMYTLSYGSLVAVAFKAIQEQQATIVALQNRVAALEAAE